MSRVTIVCGSPGSGKTTYVKDHMEKGDLIIDLDWIYRAISNTENTIKDERLVPFVFEVRDALYNRLNRPNDLRKAWIVACLPKAQDREAMSRRFSAEVILINRTRKECMQQILGDKNRINNASFYLKLLTDWFNNYTPRDKDILI
jgi:adenylate kinase family enzyme